MFRIIVSISYLLLLSGQGFGQTRFVIPLGGNSFLTKEAVNGKEEVTNDGWANWEHSDAVWSVYIWLSKPGTIRCNWVMSVPGNGTSEIEVNVGNVAKTIEAGGWGEKTYTTGDWKIADSGYVCINVRGVKKTGNSFGTVSVLTVEGTAVDDRISFVKNNTDNYFYWGRRGPSVHINYDLSSIQNDIEWFYSEITVPVGNDIQGSYFMANGFAEGYFGMQVNSDTERRILFSVWSPFKTDDPKKIPDSQRIVMVHKGKDVYTGEFGNEGSGGQSILRYNWKAGTAYKFLLRARPVEHNYTNYTAWFYTTETGKWRLIASFNRPATSTYLKRLHSFLENFEPATGYLTRMAWYHDQWIRTKEGSWIPLNGMIFTVDETAKRGFRLDYSGGVGENGFFLKNCGFFNKRTSIRSGFKFDEKKKQPVIELDQLEQ
jgi:hypothetical protein